MSIYAFDNLKTTGIYSQVGQPLYFLIDNGTGAHPVIVIDPILNTKFYDNNGINSVNLGTRALVDSTAATSIAWDARLLISNGLSLNWNARYLYDTGNLLSVDWGNRNLYDINGNITQDYSNLILSGNWTTNTAPTNNNSLINLGYLLGVSGVLQNSSDIVRITGFQSINSRKKFSGLLEFDILSGKFIYASGETGKSIDLNNKFLINNNQIIVNWNANQLSDNTNQISVDWQNKILSGNWNTNTIPISNNNLINLNFLNTTSGIIIAQNTSFATIINLQITGSNLYNLTTGLSGNLFLTGANLQGNINSLSGYVNNNFVTNTVLYNQLTGIITSGERLINPVISGIVSGNSFVNRMVFNSDINITGGTDSNYFQTISGLSFSIGANEIWSVNSYLTTSGGSPGLKFKFLGPSGTGYFVRSSFRGTNSNAATFQTESLTGFNFISSNAYNSYAGVGKVDIDTSIVNGSTTGLFSILVQTTTAAQSTGRILQGSFMTARQHYITSI